MATALVIGSGPAAAGAALALAGDSTCKVTVVDIGGELESDLQSARHSLATSTEESWDGQKVDLISRQPVPSRRGVIPQKRAFGSDFPFRDFGQLAGVTAVADANSSVISGAYGGFSNVWGAQIMPFSKATFDRWPVSFGEMESHYKTALGEMGFAGEDDDLAELFPLIGDGAKLPKVAQRTEAVLRRYGENRALVRSHGLTIGRARLAFGADLCTCCGLCMTGCPYSLVYSASQTMDRLRREGRIEYRSGLIAYRIEEVDGIPAVHVRDLASGKLERLAADRVFVGCGGIGTTRLVLGSLDRFDSPVELQESVQFVMPTISLAPCDDPRGQRNFTLNQFNVLYDHTGEGFDLCQIHFYDYNPAFLTSIPASLKRKIAEPALSALLRRTAVGLGYVPGWGSPRVKVKATKPSDSTSPAGVEVDRVGGAGWPPMLRSMVKAMTKTARALDLWPVVPMISVSASAKSYAPRLQ